MSKVLSRREFIRDVSWFGCAIGVSRIAYPETPVGALADSDAADRWMSKWMDALGATEGTLFLGRFADRVYFLREQISWSPDSGKQAPSVQVPIGFVTDFASIPRVFWSLLPPDGDYTYPAILHDYLYWQQPCSREQADLVLDYSMEEFKVSSVQRKTIYEAVRLGGQLAWNSNRKLREGGERRILKQYPTDPKIRWADWKRREGVFL